MKDPFQRALAAFYRSAKWPETPMEPSQALSGMTTLNGLEYVVLRNTHQVLAVYRVRNDGMLKRLLRWPKELNDQ